MRPPVLGLVAVEHARGGQGEETPREREDDDHCGLCALTRDRGAWEALGEELGVPVGLRASDDLSPEESPVVREVGTPCVIARFDDNEHRAVVLAERLETFGGEVALLVREVRLVAHQQGWHLPRSEEPEEQAETV